MSRLDRFPKLSDSTVSSADAKVFGKQVEWKGDTVDVNPKWEMHACIDAVLSANSQSAEKQQHSERKEASDCFC